MVSSGEEMNRWEEHYTAGEMPWDTGVPDHNLVSVVADGRILPGKTLEIGCGTGTNSLWLSNGGFQVLGIDIAPTAIEMARSKAEGRTNPDFRCMDFLEEDFSSDQFDFVLDRGTFHTFDAPEIRMDFAHRVADLLTPGGLWLSLIGSTEGPAREHGPPRRNARNIVDALEPVLEIAELRSSAFGADNPAEDPAWMAWVCIARKRTEPAQPPSSHG